MGPDGSICNLLVAGYNLLPGLWREVFYFEEVTKGVCRQRFPNKRLSRRDLLRKELAPLQTAAFGDLNIENCNCESLLSTISI